MPVSFRTANHRATLLGFAATGVIFLALTAGCGDTPKGPKAAKKPKAGDLPDVVLVTLDTTRADRIGAYGYANAQTDTIDALAARGMRFNNAYSPMPLTIPSHATMMTGLLPFHHNIRSNGDNVLAPNFVTLAEQLHDAGYSTAASVAAFVTTRQWGFSQGFDAYYDSMPEGDAADKNFWHTERPGDQVVDDALGWLAAQPTDKPVFLWVHLYDAHFPYVPKEPYTESMGDRPYDAELAFVDDQVGRLVDAFAGRKVLWAVLSDHGEALGEHGEMTHGLFNYNATQHVPFILAGEGVSSGVHEEPVSTADLMPSILTALGLPVPDGLDGTPQPGKAEVPYAESYQLSDRFKIAPHRMVVDGNLKLIDTPRPELYDLVADPHERNNLADARPDDVTRMKKLLTDKNATPPNANSGSTMDAETQAQLASLGYIAPSQGTVDYGSLPDPKDFKPFFEKLRKIEIAGGSTAPEEMLALVDEAIALKPDAFELRMRRVTLLTRLKRGAEAKAYVTALSKEFGDKPQVWITLGSMAMQDRQPEQAIEYARSALAHDPKNASAQELEVQALFQLGREAEAFPLATKYTDENSSNYGVSALLGQYWLNKKDFHKAEKYLRVAVSGPTPRRAARSQLALLAVAAGARQDGYKLLEAEVQDFPGNIVARRMLSKLYGEDQRWIDQKPQAEAVARAFPKDAEAHRHLAQCLFNLADYPGARTAMNSALKFAPEDPDILLLHANLLAKEGKKDEGYAIFQKATALNEARVRAAEKKGATVIEIDPVTRKPITPKPTDASPAAPSGPKPVPPVAKP
jgi:arylsulfatase A-like enzyme/tetratricopeptide (TPR) repeat protein